MAKADRQSLAEYAVANPVRTTKGCWVCGLPEREEIEAAKRAGVAKSVIRRWLVEECGYDTEPNIATPNKLDNHFANHLGR